MVNAHTWKQNRVKDDKEKSMVTSQEQNFEESTARQISLELRDGTNSVSIDLQRDPHSSLEIQGIRSIRKLLKSCCALIATGHIYMKKIFETHGGCRNWKFLPYFFLAPSVGTALFYIPMVNGNKMCIQLDKDLGTIASVNHLFYAVDKIFRLGHAVICKNARKHSWLFFLIEILVILPIPQFFWSRPPNKYQLFGERICSWHYSFWHGPGYRFGWKSPEFYTIRNRKINGDETEGEKLRALAALWKAFSKPPVVD